MRSSSSIRRVGHTASSFQLTPQSVPGPRVPMMRRCGRSQLGLDCKHTYIQTHPHTHTNTQTNTTVSHLLPPTCLTDPIREGYLSSMTCTGAAGGPFSPHCRGSVRDETTCRRHARVANCCPIPDTSELATVRRADRQPAGQTGKAVVDEARPGKGKRAACWVIGTDGTENVAVLVAYGFRCLSYRLPHPLYAPQRVVGGDAGGRCSVSFRKKEDERQ
ncbi:hypothetical protein GGR56DRAFT_457103 [Xylariaceae sp. FL0804]|nr:hypothetical protein GGR56DRAFT_457103 [Xylariaceae sp. FL0804]